MPPSIPDRLDSLDEAVPVVDSDLHAAPLDEGELVARLPERFREKGLSYPEGNWPSPVDGGPQSIGSGDGTGGTVAEILAADHLDPLGIDHAVITGNEAVHRAAVQPDRRYAAALASAYNDWQVEELLAADDRFAGSIAVTPIAPAAAAEEIHRLGDTPEMVQVVMGAGSQNPLGQERYWPIYEAAAEAGLPVAIHAGSGGYGVANPNTGAGYPSTALERRSVVPALFMGQLLSLVLEGVFVEFPDLQVVFVESGYSWLPSFLWRVDKVWKGVTDDFPWVERPPSEYVREHVWIVTRPLAEATDPGHADRMLEMVAAREMLLFGSSYPDRESYAPADDVPDLDPALAEAIFSSNATDLYGL